MSKDIEAGTWWLDEDGDIVYVGYVELTLPFKIRDSEVPFYYYYESGDGDVIGRWGSEDQLVRELPGCTGFDYKEPPAVHVKEPPAVHVATPVPSQWIPYVDGDGKAFMILGYPVPTR